VSLRQLLSPCPGADLVPLPVGGSKECIHEPETTDKPRASRLVRAVPSAEEQVGLLQVAGLSQRGFALIRRVFCGCRIGMASASKLRQARKRMEALPTKQRTEDAAGAHIADPFLAVQERVSALCAADRFVERHVYDKKYEPIVKTALLADASGGDPGVLLCCLPLNMKDVCLTVCLDKGGCPASVKIVVGVTNQARPNAPNNNIFAAVCPCKKTNYADFHAMLRTLEPQVIALLTSGLLVNGERRAVRLFPNGNYYALCTSLGHKRASATMPCLVCLCTRSPNREHHALNAEFSTLQEMTGTRTPRSERQYASHCRTGPIVGRNATTTPSELPLAHLSVPLAPLLPAVPQQTVVIPLHITLGMNGRSLSMATECVFRCQGFAAGLRFAHRFAARLQSEVRVTPARYHGGGLIGRDCHRIGDRSDVICRLLGRKLSEEHHTAYERAWLLWSNRVRKPLNRAAIATADVVKHFPADACAFVAHLQSAFTLMNISPKPPSAALPCCRLHANLRERRPLRRASN